MCCLRKNSVITIKNKQEKLYIKIKPINLNNVELNKVLSTQDSLF